MTTAATSLLGLALPVTGELAGTWGDTVNNSITSLLDSAVAGTTTLSTDGDVTLTTTTLAANQARQAILLCSGARTALRTITAPAQSKIYTIINATTGGYSVKLVGAGPTTGVTIVAGESAICAWNGSDFIKISNTGGSASFTNVTVSGTTTLSGLTASTALALNSSKEVVSVTNTGTGNNVLSASPTLTGTVAGASLQLSSLTATRVTYAGASGLLQDSANLTFDGTSLTLGGNPTLSAGTANGVLYLNGSKVATSGSALTFDGTNFSATGTTTVNSANSSQVALVVKGETGNGIRQNFIGQASSGQYNWQIGASITAAGYFSIIPSTAADGTTFSSSAYSITPTGISTWYVGGTRTMDLTSTGLGIGTSSPGAKLEVYNSSVNGAFVPNTLSTWRVAQIRNDQSGTSGSAAGIAFVGKSDTQPAGIVAINGNTTGGVVGLGFLTVTSNTTSESMRLDSSGNLGLGASSMSLWGTASNPAIYIKGTNSGYAGRSGALVLASYDGLTNVAVANDSGSGALQFYIGTSEKMRLDSSGNLGLGVTPSAWASGQVAIEMGGTVGNLAFNSSGATHEGYLYWNAFYNGTNTLYKANGYAAAYGHNNGAHKWFITTSGTAGGTVSFTQAMTLDASGNLGVGVTSMKGRLALINQVANGNYAQDYTASSSANGQAVFNSYYTAYSYSGGSADYPRFLDIASVGSPDGTNGGGIIRFLTNPVTANASAVERARIDSSGNLGLGVTPSAWSGVNPVFEFGNTGVSASLFQNGFNDTWFSSNVYFNGSNWIYKGTSTATQYYQGAGTHKWFIAPSGTGGTAATLTQAMTLTAGGNLLVGSTSTPTSGSANIVSAYASGGGVQVAHNNSGGGALFGALGGGGVATYTYTGAVGSESYTERARIDSSGNLLVGTTSQTLGTARLCVSSSGLTTVSTTSTSSESPYASFNTATSGNNQFMWFYTGDSGQTFRGSIEFNRAAGLVTYNTTSDYRAKDIIGPVENSGELIDSIPVYMGKMKGATQERPMFIAHETPAYAHTGEKDAVDKEGNPVYQQMDASALIPVMWAEIQALRKRLADAGIA